MSFIGWWLRRAYCAVFHHAPVNETDPVQNRMYRVCERCGLELGTVLQPVWNR